MLSPAEWEEIAIVSAVHPVAGSADDLATVTPAPGTKCVRCWRVLPEVGSVAGASVAVPALRRRGGVGPGMPVGRVREATTMPSKTRLPLPLREGVGGRGAAPVASAPARTPPPNPLPQGEGVTLRALFVPRMTRNRLTLIGMLSGLVVLPPTRPANAWVLHGIDLPEIGQIVLLPVLNLTFVRNSGVTFGLLNGYGTWSYLVLAAVALAVVAALGVWLRRAESPLVAVSLGAIAGGAIGNVIDRLRFGSVVDFIDVHLGDWHWYVFNVADAAIVCGVAALVLDNFLPHRSNPHAHHRNGWMRNEACAVRECAPGRANRRTRAWNGLAAHPRPPVESAVMATSHSRGRLLAAFVAGRLHTGSGRLRQRRRSLAHLRPDA